MVAVVIGVIPFVTEYARRQDEALDNRHRSLQALAVTVAAASEQVSIAATGLNGISEAAQENYSKTERLAKEIADKVAELDAALARSRKDDTDSVARLDVYVAKFAKVAADIDAAVAKESKAAETRKAAKAAAAAAAAVAAASAPEPAPVIASLIPEVKPAAAASEHPFYPPVAPKAPEPEPAPVVVEAPTPEPVPESAPAPIETAKEETPKEAAAASVEDMTPEPMLADPLETAPPVALPPRKRAPRKPAPEPDLVLESVPADEPAPAAAQDVPEPAVSADGATRLIVTAYIGIGNRLFIRGDGPGLAWDKGVPLTFVSIGKWRWETNDATSTIRFRLFKNDTVECTTLGEASVEPGAQQELSAAF